MSKVINIVNFENVHFIVCQLLLKAVKKKNWLLIMVIFIWLMTSQKLSVLLMLTGDYSLGQVEKLTQS